MTLDELRALCMALPGTHEKETWGDGETPGHPTFRVRDRIYVIAGEQGEGISVRTSLEQQADLVDAFPDLVRPAAYTGRFGWVRIDLPAADDELVRGIVESAWRRTAPKAVVRAFEGAGA
jgi:predicted DNA-binding protein (MmcQ/YjbR family)